MADEQSRTASRGFASMDEKKQREIASKGGQASGGNFRNNRERAAQAGRKGGQSVPAAQRSFSRDHGLAAEAGRKGGEHSQRNDGGSRRPRQAAASSEPVAVKRGTPERSGDAVPEVAVAVEKVGVADDPQS